jgi:hypothetical protein
LLAARDVLQAADGPTVELTEPSEMDVRELAEGLVFFDAVILNERSNGMGPPT